MSLFKDAIKKGISDSISKAVKEAATNVVAPAVNKVAEAASAKINEVSNEISQNVNEANESLNEAAAQLNTAVEESNQAAVNAGTDLGTLFGSFVNNATSFAANLATNLKECPSCGEAAPADSEFCPCCGAKLPEKTIADGFKCSVCGEVNPIGQAYCVKCGGKLNATVEKEQKLAKEWKEKLADYPVWNCGGSDYYIEENGDNEGYPIYLLSIDGTTENAVKKYIEVLKEAGFAVPEGMEADAVLTKNINGVNRVFSYQDYYNSGNTSVYFLVKSYAKKTNASSSKQTLSDLISDNQETIDKAAAAAKDVAGEAVKVFSGLFGKKK